MSNFVMEPINFLSSFSLPISVINIFFLLVSTIFFVMGGILVRGTPKKNINFIYLLQYFSTLILVLVITTAIVRGNVIEGLSKGELANFRFILLLFCYVVGDKIVEEKEV